MAASRAMGKVSNFFLISSRTIIREHYLKTNLQPHSLHNIDFLLAQYMCVQWGPDLGQLKEIRTSLLTSIKARSVSKTIFWSAKWTSDLEGKKVSIMELHAAHWAVGHLESNCIKILKSWRICNLILHWSKPQCFFIIDKATFFCMKLRNTERSPLSCR